jgi:N-methylhydantoinase B
MSSEAIPAEALDLVDVEIFGRSLENIANEMGTVMVRSSGSPAIAEAADFSTLVLDGAGELLAFGGNLAFHAGPARRAVRYLIEVFPEDQIRPGDMFICNDPHTTGNAHQPDVGVIRPIFRDGRRIAWCWAEAHTYDVGGMGPGGFAPMATETYGEGLRLPGTKIVSEGEVIADVWRLIEVNVRVPAMVLNDVRCMMAACNRGEQRLQEVFDRWDLDLYERYVEEIKSAAERALRGRIETLPDGEWTVEDFAEHDGHRNDLFRIRCTVRVDGDRLAFDFAGSAPQAEGFINCSLPAAEGMLICPILVMLVPDLPINEGTFRAVEVTAPTGSVCNPEMPAPTSSGHMEVGNKISHCVTRLLAELQARSSSEWVRDHVMSAWHDCWPGAVFYAPLESGELVPFLDMHGGSAGGGAQPVGDGLDCAASLSQLQNGIPDIELNESQYPVLYLWRRLNRGSGGAGRFRGGNGVDLGWTPWRTAGGQGHFFLSSWQVAATGTAGGYPGAASHFEVRKGAEVDRRLSEGTIPQRLEGLAGESLEVEAKHFGIPVTAGDVVTMGSGGGSGLGDPLDRDPVAVLADLRDGVIDREIARTAYGVVCGEGLEGVDGDATALRREELRAERRTWTEGTLMPVAETGERPVRVRRTNAGERFAELGSWCRSRSGVEVVEYADPETGSLLHVEVAVTEP